MPDCLPKFLACAVLVLLAGCGWFRDSADDYRQARELPPLQLPDGLDGSRIQPFYAIPPARGQAVAGDAFAVPRPEPIRGDASDQAVRIQKLGTDQWALAKLAPDQAWPLLKLFLQANRIPLLLEDGAQGLMVTAALQPEGQLPQEQYLVRIDAGVQRNTSEIHVRQRRLGGEPAGLRWPARSDDAQREYALLYQLATHLASRSGEASVSLLAQGIRAASKVNLQQEGGQPYLLLELGYERAWASLGNALPASGFRVVDQDLSAGTYYVQREADEGERPGWWARLWGAGDDAVTDAGASPWQVTLGRTGEVQAEIRIHAADGSMDAAQQLHYLNLIKGQLR